MNARPEDLAALCDVSNRVRAAILVAMENPDGGTVALDVIIPDPRAVMLVAGFIEILNCIPDAQRADALFATLSRYATGAAAIAPRSLPVTLAAAALTTVALVFDEFSDDPLWRAVDPARRSHLERYIATLSTFVFIPATDAPTSVH